MVKVVTKQLTKIIEKRNILKGRNHAALPHSSIFTPLQIINAALEDAKENQKEIWMLFQDLSKAYDHVNLDMLRLTIKCIKLSTVCCNFFINLFTSRKNRIIRHYGLTDPYDVLIGIDQGEVILPLFWTIYFDLFLCEIRNNKDLSYHISYS